MSPFPRVSSLCQVHQYQLQQQLKFQIQKSPVITDEASLCWRSGWAGTPLSWHPSGTLNPVSGAPIQFQQQLKFQIQKNPVIADETSLCWRSGWAGIPLSWHPSGTLDPVSGTPIQFQQRT